MANTQVRMRELARPSAPTSGSPLLLPIEARNYELRGIHFKMLPSFEGKAKEDPLKFIRNFCNTLEQLPLRELTEDQLRMKYFPYTLKEEASAWWMTLPVASMTTWQEVYDKFMEKYFSPSKSRGDAHWR